MAKKTKHVDSYVQSKIDHMRRIGVVTGDSKGTGRYGGACPDELAKEQREQPREA